MSLVTASDTGERALDASIGQAPACRFCSAPVRHTVIDLGMSPLCESFIQPSEANRMEPFYPLCARVCESCWLMQLEAYVAPEEIFQEYAYFSSFSDTWIEHARLYSEAMIERFALDASTLVVELGSNDGYLLQHFVRQGVPVLGIEPARNVAAVAIERGVPTEIVFHGRESALRLSAGRPRPRLIAGNNVLAQVPDLNDFVAGIKVLLDPQGVVTIEFPHLQRLIEGNQFDTIYHEHFSYFSLGTANRVFAAHGLRIFDVEELPTHGGSLRIYACHRDDASKAMAPSVSELLVREEMLGYSTPSPYDAFRERVEETKRALLDFLIDARRAGKSVAGYGAPGKANTLLNYCGIRRDLLEFTVDRNPYKHGCFTPGTRIPIFPPEHLAETRPDYVLILPWNLRQEIEDQLAYIREWGGRLVVPIPRVEVIS